MKYTNWSNFTGEAMITGGLYKGKEAVWESEVRESEENARNFFGSPANQTHIKEQATIFSSLLLTFPLFSVRKNTTEMKSLCLQIFEA